MKPVFADTFYYLALLNVRDKAHAQALALSQLQHAGIVTTAWVLTELADGLSHAPHRSAFHRLVTGLRGDPKTTIVGPDRAMFEKGLSLYEARPDKDWSLTDCISFVVMEQDGLTEALTADHHFEQAGFRALLK